MNDTWIAHVSVPNYNRCNHKSPGSILIKAGSVDFIEKPLDKRSSVRKVKSLLPENGNHKHLGKPLTQSEQRVLKLVLDGKRNREIAGLLSRSHKTIEVHRAHIMQKIGDNSLVDLVRAGSGVPDSTHVYLVF